SDDSKGRREVARDIDQRVELRGLQLVQRLFLPKVNGHALLLSVQISVRRPYASGTSSAAWRYSPSSPHWLRTRNFGAPVPRRSCSIAMTPPTWVTPPDRPRYTATSPSTASAICRSLS